MLARCILAALAGGAALQVLGSPVAGGSQSRRRDVPASHVMHERHLSHWSQQWTKRDKVEASTILPMRIGLKQSNLESGHDLLMDISNPSSPNYGQHLSAREVIDYFAPDKESVDAVTKWLVGSGISADRIGLSVNKQWIQFDATTAEAENLLYADYWVYQHSSGSHDLSTESYHIPADVQAHVDYVTPGIRMRKSKRAPGQQDVGHTDRITPKARAARTTPFPTNSTSCNVYITAECVRAQYGVPNATLAAPGNKLGIFEALDQHHSNHDLDVFFSTLYPNIPNGTYPEERLVDGAIGAIEDAPQLHLEVGGEAALDFQAAWPLIYPQGTVLWQQDDENYEQNYQFEGFWNTFLDSLDGSYCTYSAYGETGNCVDPSCADPVYPNPNPGGYKGQLQCGVYEPTNVISISYAGDEYDLPDFYMFRQCSEFMKLALQGVTTIFSSGDDGVGSVSECRGDNHQIFAPLYGGTCPYVLAVGSTELRRPAGQTPKPYEKLEEVATTRFPSGGGFSNIWGIPSWQRDAVDAYFDKVDLPFSGYHHYVNNGSFETVKGGVFHHGGRAYPDVAAIGDDQVVYISGQWYLIGGTSLSAPLWGALLTLINEERIAAGKKTLGLIHQAIYAHPEAFNDITVGSNPGCNSPGFVAAPGWDPVTGLGSPNFPVLSKLLVDL